MAKGQINPHFNAKKSINRHTSQGLVLPKNLHLAEKNIFIFLGVPVQEECQDPESADCTQNEVVDGSGSGLDEDYSGSGLDLDYSGSGSGSGSGFMDYSGSGCDDGSSSGCDLSSGSGLDITDTQDYDLKDEDPNPGVNVTKLLDLHHR